MKKSEITFIRLMSLALIMVINALILAAIDNLDAILTFLYTHTAAVTSSNIVIGNIILYMLPKPA